MISCCPVRVGLTTSHPLGGFHGDKAKACKGQPDDDRSLRCQLERLITKNGYRSFPLITIESSVVQAFPSTRMTLYTEKSP